MTLEEARTYEGRVVSVRTSDPDYGGGVTYTGRFEILDETTFQVVGQPKWAGLPAGDATPYKDLIERISEITPLS